MVARQRKQPVHQIGARPPETLLRISAERYGRPAKLVDRAISEALGVTFPS